jgi:ACS family hexuronate transporter-like MFS transporter
MGRWSRLALLVLLVTSGVINYADRQVIAVLKPLLEQQLHWRDGDYALLVTIFQFSAALAYLGAGWFVDRVGLKWANPIGVAAWSLAAMAHAAASTLAQFAVARVALGATESIGTPAAVKAIAVLFEARARSVVAPAIALGLGWRATFLLLGGVGLIWAGAWLLFTRGVEFPRSAEAVSAPRETWCAVLSDRTTWAVAGGKVLTDQLWWLLLFWAPDLFHRLYHLGLDRIGAPVALLYVGAMAGSIAGGFAASGLMAAGLEARRARLATLFASAALTAPLAFVFAFHSLALTVAVLALVLGAHQSFAANLFAFTADTVPVSRVGSTISVAAFCGNLSGMSMLALTGYAVSSGLGYGLPLIVSGVAYLAAPFWIAALTPARPPDRPMPEDART